MSNFNWAELKVRLRESEQLLNQAFEGQSLAKEEILRERARSLSQRSPQTLQQSAHYLEFILSSQKYALPLSALAGVFPLQKWTPLPESPPQLLGLVSYRGSVLPLMAFEGLLELPISSAPGIALVLRGQGVACRVDELADVLSVSDDEVKSLEAPGFLVQGIAPGGTTILSLEKLSKHPYFTTIKENRR